MALTYGFILVLRVITITVVYSFLYLLNMIGVYQELLQIDLDPSGLIPIFKPYSSAGTTKQGYDGHLVLREKEGRKEQNRTTTKKDKENESHVWFFIALVVCFLDFTVSSFKLPIVCQ